jgi:hypothetical protein
MDEKNNADQSCNISVNITTGHVHANNDEKICR